MVLEMRYTIANIACLYIIVHNVTADGLLLSSLLDLPPLMYFNNVLSLNS